jgi:type I restriction-modification system DNA methylase subunit
MHKLDLQQSYNRQEFDKFVKSFLPEDYESKGKTISPAFQSKYAKDIVLIGECRSLNLDVYEIRHTSTHDARVGIANDTFKLLQHNSLNNNALVAFVPEEDDGQWRFSLLQIDLEAVEKTARIRRNYSNPRRFSYVLGPGAHTRTPYDYLFGKGRIRTRTENNKTLTPAEDLKSRFSVEVLSKEFYDNLFHWYLWATQHPSVWFPDKEDPDDGRDISVKIIRLITRMLFVWFIKQKGLVPANLFDEDEMQKILKDFNPESNQDGCYYNAIIQNLFFATLNRPVVDEDGLVREFAKNPHNEDAKNLYRYAELFNIREEEVIQFFDKIPFLNASLFDCLDKSKTMNGVRKSFRYDGFSRNDNRRAHIPNELFFSKERIEKVEVEDDTREVRVQGLIRLFESYNFTIEENSPREVEVSLDPELLGRVFENLLAAYNPETGKSVRKSTGSFYTPREIVNYMVTESLVAHLHQQTKIDETLLRCLLSYDDDVPELTKGQKTLIEESIKNCKVLDPACGSGAFPMGILQQLVHLWERIYPATSTGYKTQKDAMYERKLYLIEHCIYGVDIQPIAMLISKLRFFISLICEQPNSKFDLKDRKGNYGINTLPALETKFVAANTLIPASLRGFDDSWTQDADLIKLKNELLELRHANFISRSYSKKRTNMKKDEDKRKEIEDYIVENISKPNEKKLDLLRSQITRLEGEKSKYEGERFVVETVTGDLFGSDSRTITDANAKKRKEIQDAIRKCQREIDAELQKTCPRGFEKAVKELTAWNPYDQNTSSPFFDPDWMFGITDGFDIVIGNPPYINSADQNKDKILKEQRKRLSKDKRYTTLYEKWDLYVAFLELSSCYLTKEQGVCCMIVPYPFTNQKYGLKLRKMFVEEKNLFKLVDLNGIKVFDATVFNCIPFVMNSHTLNKTMIAKGIKDEINNLSIFDSFEQPHDKLVQDAKTQVWNLTPEKRETSRHTDMHVLGDYCYVSKGMVLYSEDGLFTNEDLISDTKDAIHCREYLEAKDMDRYLINQIRFIEYNTARVPLMVSRPTFQELYENPKLLFNCLGEMKVMIDSDQQFICQQGIRVAVPWIYLNGVNNRSINNVIRKYSTLERSQMETLSKTVNLNYLLGILNSRYASVLLTNIRGGDYHVVPEHIRNIPIPSATKEQQQPIIDLVNQILAAKKSNPQADTTALEHKIDILVYLLYGLTWDEVQVVENSL